MPSSADADGNEPELTCVIYAVDVAVVFQPSTKEPGVTGTPFSQLSIGIRGTPEQEPVSVTLPPLQINAEDGVTTGVAGVATTNVGSVT